MSKFFSEIRNSKASASEPELDTLQDASAALFNKPGLSVPAHRNVMQQGIKAYEYDMTGHVQGCIEKYCELSGIQPDTLKPVATPCIDDHQIDVKDFESKGTLSSVASRIVLKCLYTARMSRMDTLWTVNGLARP